MVHARLRFRCLQNVDCALMPLAQAAAPPNAVPCCGALTSMLSLYGLPSSKQCETGQSRNIPRLIRARRRALVVSRILRLTLCAACSCGLVIITLLASSKSVWHAAILPFHLDESEAGSLHLSKVSSLLNTKSCQLQIKAEWGLVACGL